MNNRLSNENNENLEESQEKKIGSAEEDPNTTGPSENLREALEENSSENTDNEPA